MKYKIGKKSFLVLFFFAVCFYLACRPQPKTVAFEDIRIDYAKNLERISSAFLAQTSGVFVEGKGRVIRILSDDLVGDRHQRFIIELDNQQTLLIAHNIDLAPRIPGIKTGDEIVFAGEYEWNQEGGVIHWTHHDPAYRRKGGWIVHQGVIYQ